jgi:glucose/arabinose dehydrogenase
MSPRNKASLVQGRRVQILSIAAVLTMTVVSCDSDAAMPRIELVPAYPHLEFDRPLCIAHPNDGSGRMFVVEQAGRIRTIPNEADPQGTQTFLDISGKVRTAHNEEGLLALAFHPDFKTNGHFFVYYSASDPRRGVLSRFQASGQNKDVADPTSEQVILEVNQPYGNHNGATVVFGPDGFLYMSLGDGGSAGDPHGNGQNLGTLLGSILRIDVNKRDSGLAYAIPSDNPFVAMNEARPEIWAYGLRNVWRMSFDRQTGDLWAGDVGQNKWEEIDLIIRGGNYGWNIREGAHSYRPAETEANLIDPVTEYGRNLGASVTGGYVYRGTLYPELQGVYVYADFVTGTIWGLRYQGGKVTETSTLLEQPNNISSFGETPAGELLVSCFDGRIYRIEAGL